MPPEIQITRLNGLQRGKSVRFDTWPILLGTDPTCSVRFDPQWDKTVSQKHATLEWREEAWWLVDHSEQGCWIAGQRLSAPHKLDPVAEIELGRGGPKIRAEFTLAPMAAPPSPTPPKAEPAISPPPPRPPRPQQELDKLPVRKNPKRGIAAVAGAVILLLIAGGAGFYIWKTTGQSAETAQAVLETPPDEELITLIEESTEESGPAEPAPPALPTDAGKGWAVIVGVNQYSHGINSLQMCVNDANAISQTLDQSGIFSADRTYLMTDESKPDLQPTSINVERIIKSVIARAEPQDIVFFSFSGHGSWDEQKQDSMLITSDGNPENLDRTTLSGTALRDFFAQIKAEKLIVIMDACHSGGIQVKGRKAVKQAANIPESFFSQFTNSKGQVTIRSCAFNEYSYEASEIGHGIFTYHLVNALKGQSDLDKDGIVTLSEVRSHLAKSVLADAMERFGAPQTPSFTSGGFLGEVGDIPLTLISEKRARRTGTISSLKQRAAQLAGSDRISSTELDQIKRTLDLLSSKRRFNATEQEQAKLTLRLLLGKTTPGDYRLAAKALSN